MKVYWQAETGRSLFLSLHLLPLSRPFRIEAIGWGPSHIPPSMCQGKAIKTALLFLSIMKISVRFSEIPPRALKIFGIFPLKCCLMDSLEASETLVSPECIFWISVYLCGAEMAEFEV